MAINPNTDFTAGQVLTSSQANRFPRGIMSYTENTTNDLTITAEELQITGASFTAVANRYYKVTYCEPYFTSVTATSWVAGRIRLTNLAGAQKQLSYVQLPTSGVSNAFMTVIWVGTLSAGTNNFAGTLQSNAGTTAAYRSTTAPAFLMVEDIGPA